MPECLIGYVFNIAFFLFLLLASWLMVSLFWLRIATALLAHSFFCLTHLTDPWALH